MKWVPNEFPEAPIIAFVGEAPGDREMELGRPLVGPSGKLFDAVLRLADIDRAEVFVGNVFDFKLSDNDVSNICVPKSEVTPELEEQGIFKLPPLGPNGYLHPKFHEQLDKLEADLKVAGPNLIVPLGGTALWAFTGTDSIMQMRGAVDTATHLMAGTKILPTLHPAHILRQWKFYTVVIADVIKAMKEAERGPFLVPPRLQLLIEPTLEEAIDYMNAILDDERIDKDRPLSVDIETGWGQITCLGFAPNSENAICVPFVDTRKTNNSYWKTQQEELEIWKGVKEIMESPLPKLGQNYGMYDAFWFLDKMGIRTMNLLHDTRLLHHALYPELPKDLAFLGASYTDQGPWKHMRGKKSGDKRDD